MYLHQGPYIEKVLNKFGQVEAKPVSTPADLNVRLEKEDGVSRSIDAILYQSFVGSLLYAAIATRPDIAQAVGVVLRFCTNPKSFDCSETNPQISQRNCLSWFEL